jgi:hypothetical protein
MLETISARRSLKVNEVIFGLKSSPGLPFLALLSSTHLEKAMEKNPPFRDRVFPPCGHAIGVLVSSAKR